MEGGDRRRRDGTSEGGAKEYMLEYERCKTNELTATKHTRSPCYLHLNLSSSVLGGLELLHQHVVTQEVALCGRQPGQQLVLQKLQLNLEHVLLFGQFTLQGVYTNSLHHFGN